MKKIKLIFALFVSILCLCSCESAMNRDEQSEIDCAQKEVSISESAVDAVLSFVKEVYPQKYKTLSSTKEVLKPEFITNVSYEKSKFFAPTANNTSRELDTLLSIINFGDNEGFAIVSTKDNQILAVTENGNLTIDDLTMDYTTEDFENNPKAVISNYISNYIVVPPGPMVPADSINMGYAVHGPWVTETQIHPLVQLKLHQGDPYNSYCPKKDGQLCPTGCAAIALTQMMSVNKYPTSAGGINITWNRILEQYPAALIKKSLALWIKAIADECKTEYAVDQSGAAIDSVMLCLRSFPRYTNVHIKMSPGYEDIYPMLVNTTPVLFASWDLQENNNTIDTIGHMWVVDGCIYQKQRIQLYDHNNVLTGEIYDTRDYVHCNWGWGGNCDGYYITNVFNLNNGAPIPDEGSTGSGNLNLDYATLAIRYNFE